MSSARAPGSLRVDRTAAAPPTTGSSSRSGGAPVPMPTRQMAVWWGPAPEALAMGRRTRGTQLVRASVEGRLRRWWRSCPTHENDQSGRRSDTSRASGQLVRRWTRRAGTVRFRTEPGHRHGGVGLHGASRHRAARRKTTDGRVENSKSGAHRPCPQARGVRREFMCPQKEADARPPAVECCGPSSLIHSHGSPPAPRRPIYSAPIKLAAGHKCTHGECALDRRAAPTKGCDRIVGLERSV